ncbi:hypothetical protein BRADI_4g25165v3 [Brachypodium distachyon]|uniref:Uncharacterized protein n=1 Tax=Brachypodium distachyon TaxID=15368 RepID=A0A2K2CQ36_BRADI|nr:hypothetical protein BRADI_4g25165v3 [Brachypodium distachyon]
MIEEGVIFMLGEKWNINVCDHNLAWPCHYYFLFSVHGASSPQTPGSKLDLHRDHFPNFQQALNQVL